MSNHNRIHLPGMPSPGGQPTVAIAAPINDVQLVALIAATLLPHAQAAPGTVMPTGQRDPGAALELAFSLVAGAIVRYKAGRLDHYAAQHEAALKADHAPVVYQSECNVENPLDALTQADHCPSGKLDSDRT